MQNAEIQLDLSLRPFRACSGLRIYKNRSINILLLYKSLYLATKCKSELWYYEVESRYDDVQISIILCVTSCNLQLE